jgi:hypothetical protein
MNATAPHLRCYLVEWYRADLTDEALGQTLAQLHQGAASLSAEGSPTQVLLALTVPSDEVVLGVFAASSAEIVSQACDRAGLPAERVTAALAGPFA